MFVCEIEPGYVHTVLAKSDECICIVPLGHSFEVPVSLFVALSPLPGQFPDGFELVFSVVLARESPNEATFFDGLETLELIPDRGDRATVRNALHSAVEALIDAMQPQSVTMITYASGLPEKALRKFHEVAVVFQGKGYESGMADPFHGQQIWMMRRA